MTLVQALVTWNTLVWLVHHVATIVPHDLPEMREAFQEAWGC